MAVKFTYRVCAGCCFLGFLVHSPLSADCPLPPGIAVLHGPRRLVRYRACGIAESRRSVVRVPVPPALSLGVAVTRY